MQKKVLNHAPLMRRWFLAGSLLASGVAFAFMWPERAPSHHVLPATGSLEVAFTPGQDADGLVIRAIGQARQQVLVQAFSFTHEGIAKALIAAHERGIEVKVIADREQTQRIERSRVPMLARAGIAVWLDSEHQSAHNKVMMIDAGLPVATLVTGSYNFTFAAQNKNAENLMVMRGNEKLVALFRDNWTTHLGHSRPYGESQGK